MQETPEFSKILQVDSLSEAAKRVRLEANDTERAALAARFELISVESLTGDLIVERTKGSELIRVRGRMAAEIRQSCVISGDPVAATIEESVDERFGEPGDTDIEIEVSLDEEDPPEPIENGEIDLGEVVAQILGVAIDPYPRASGAEIPQQYQAKEGDSVEMRKNPFEVLSSLKREGD